VRTDKAALAGTLVFASLLALVVGWPLMGLDRATSEDNAHSGPLVERDLDAIAQDTLRVLVIHDPLTWESRPGAETGLEWELLRRFGRAHALHLRAIPVDDPDSMLMMLQRGEGDVMAGQLSPSGWASPWVAFTKSYRSFAPIRAVLNVDRTMRPAVRETHRPGSPDTLRVSRWSPFIGLEQTFDSSFGAITLLVDPTLPEDLLVQVAVGSCPGALVVDAISSVESRRMPQLHFGPRLARSVPLAFAVRRNSPALLAAMNDWLTDPDEVEARDLIASNYGDGRLTNGPMRSLHSLEFAADSISPYDTLFQAHTDSSNLDWQLLAAVCYKESRFDTSARSSAGAHGLMQLMPKTAAAMGVAPDQGADAHIGGARKYLDRLDSLFLKSVPNKDQRLRFALASYNAGPGHVQDAQRLARLLGLDPRRWDGSVERTLLLLAKPRWYTRSEVQHGYCRAHETFWFVRDVIAAFGQYRDRATRPTSTPLSQRTPPSSGPSSARHHLDLSAAGYEPVPRAIDSTGSGSR